MSFNLRISQQMLMILPTLLLLTQSRSEARPQHNEASSYPASLASTIQITKERVVQIQPKALNLANITAHTQEILAKIDEVNRQHGYRKPITPKRSHFVPGYFTNNYNYKERVLKGFDHYDTIARASPTLDEQVYQQLLNKLQPQTEEIEEISIDKSKNPNFKKQSLTRLLQDNISTMKPENYQMQDLQAQLSVDHVKQIVRNYPYQGPFGYPEPHSYPGYADYYKHHFPLLNYQSQNMYMPQPTQATSIMDNFELLPSYYNNPFYRYQIVPMAILPHLYTPMPAQTLSPPITSNNYPKINLEANELLPIIYTPYWLDYSSANNPIQEELCTEEAKRAPKILDKSKTLLKPHNATKTKLNSSSPEEESSIIHSEQSKHISKEMIENIDQSGHPENKSELLSLVKYPSSGRRKSQVTRQQQQQEEQTPQNLNSRRNTKRPSIFHPHTWFNNQPMLDSNHKKNKTEDDEKTSEDVADSISIEGSESSHKGLGLFAHNNRRKIFGKDNTGSGIFIQKLKVRKGGVAIAGPGGIATAGSGGTAIVGPNGYAFTHPDSLAIAGSGTKVIAVDPNINLSDLVNNGTLTATLRERVGKLVATGPVVYYNKG